MDDPSVPVLQKLTHPHIPVPFDAIMNILATRKMDTLPGPYPSVPFSSLYLSLDLKVSAPLCILSLTCSNNQPIHQWDIHHHHHRAEGFGGRASWHGVGVDAADYWSLGRFQGFGRLYAWFCRRLTDADMRLQTSLSRRRSSITVHPQSTVCASTRRGCERYSNVRFPGSDQA